MTKTNLEVVQALYAAFDAGNIEATAALMAEDIVWNEAENNKLADRNPYVGSQAVIEGVFGWLAEDFAVEIGSFAASGDTIAMRGRHRGTAKATGETINQQIVHWWTVKNGKLTAYQQHVDTQALGEV